jgi:hypothetical protein|tara:strand:+ start:380 stop:856 length:477 start_codon:yes stop_codon:yes gene_type:complete
MSKILQAVRDASTDVLTIGGFEFRIRRVCSADLARVGFAWLSMATPDADGDGAGPSMDMMAALKRADEKKLVQLAALKDAVVAAGLVAIGHGGTWDECQVTLKQSEEDADKGIIWIGSLPADVDNEIFAGVMSLSTDGGNAATRLQSFRGPARDASTA